MVEQQGEAVLCPQHGAVSLARVRGGDVAAHVPQDPAPVLHEDHGAAGPIRGEHWSHVTSSPPIRAHLRSSCTRNTRQPGSSQMAALLRAQWADMFHSADSTTCTLRVQILLSHRKKYFHLERLLVRPGLDGAAPGGGEGVRGGDPHGDRRQPRHRAAAGQPQLEDGGVSYLNGFSAS